MADFTSVSISPPKDWQAFERHARVLFELILGDPQTQNNGRAGQPQHGVDIYGRRGGASGPLVGVQCKGKDVDYGGRISRAELRSEVKKSENFQPSISEFILITTAPDDAEIQREARVLERELRSTGRHVSIAVWGWGHLQQEIGRHAETIRIFHPDGSPFTDELIAQGAKIATIIDREAEKTTRIEEMLTQVLSALPQLQIAYADNRPIDDDLNRHLHDQIDSYRDLIIQGRARTALSLLSALRAKLPTTATDKVRYRVYGNIGVCHHKLGELKVAAATFLEAAELDKDNDPICASNKIVALLLLERREEAYELSVQTSNNYPNHADVAIQRLQARRKTEDLERIFQSFAASVAREPRVALVYLTLLRAEGRPEWILGLKQAFLDNPDFLPLRLMRGETVLESVLGRDRVALGAGGPEIPTLDDVSAAADAFQTAWAKSISDETPAPFAAAHNAALAFMVLGDINRAGEILDEAFRKGYDAEESIRFRVSILRRQRRDRDAILLADTLPASPTNAIYQADLRSVTDPKAARSILFDRERYSDRADVVAAAAIYAESLLHEGDAPAALEEALRLRSLLADDPHTWLLLHSVHLALGEASAATDLDHAIQLSKVTSDFGARFMVSDALVKAGRYDDAVDLLKGRVTTEYDGPALRLLIVAAANADRRPVLADLLRDLPLRVRETPFYRSAKAALAIQSGDIRGAEQTLREYLVLQPRDLEMHLQLLHVLLTLEKIDELRDQVIRPPTDFDGPPQDLLHLSHFIQKFGDWRDGLKLAYRTLLHNEGNAAVNIRYVGFFFGFGQKMDLAVASNTVELDMAICLQHAEGITEVYVLEPNSDLRTTVRHLSPTHGLARSLLGHKVSSEVTLPDDSIAKIEWIKPKEVHALHQVLHRFQNLFPESGGLEKVNVQPRSPDGLQPILDRVQARHEVFKSAFDFYSSGGVPISLLARSLGGDPVDVFLGLVQAGRPLFVCNGSHEERKTAFSAIQANQRKGCVLDGITLNIAQALGIERALLAVCGPIAIVEATLLNIQTKIHELEARIDQSELSLVWAGGQIYRNEITPAEKQHARNLLLKRKLWITNECEILPARGTNDLSPNLRELTQRFGGSFIDELRASEESGRLFVSEDRLLRELGIAEFKLRTSWLQPILMRASSMSLISRDEYSLSALCFIKSNVQFVSIDAQFLVWSLGGTKQHSLPQDFLLVAERLGGVNAHLNSHLSVAFSVIGATWQDLGLSSTLRLAVVSCMLDNLIKERPLDDIAVLLHAFREFGRFQLRDRRFLEHLDAWQRGHFIFFHRAAGLKWTPFVGPRAVETKVENRLLFPFSSSSRNL